MDEWYLGECFLSYPKTLLKKPERKKSAPQPAKSENRENLARGQKKQ